MTVHLLNKRRYIVELTLTVAISQVHFISTYVHERIPARTFSMISSRESPITFFHYLVRVWNLIYKDIQSNGIKYRRNAKCLLEDLQREVE